MVAVIEHAGVTHCTFAAISKKYDFQMIAFSERILFSENFRARGASATALRDERRRFENTAAEGGPFTASQRRAGLFISRLTTESAAQARPSLRVTGNLFNLSGYIKIRILQKRCSCFTDGA